MFIDISFFGRTAEVAHQYLKKGSKVLVDGRLKLDQWTDTSGQKRSKHSLVVESMKMLSDRDVKEDVKNMNYDKKDNIYGIQDNQKPNIDLSITEEDMPF